MKKFGPLCFSAVLALVASVALAQNEACPDGRKLILHPQDIEEIKKWSPALEKDIRAMAIRLAKDPEVELDETPAKYWWELWQANQKGNLPYLVAKTTAEVWFVEIGKGAMNPREKIGALETFSGRSHTWVLPDTTGKMVGIKIESSGRSIVWPTQHKHAGNTHWIYIRGDGKDTWGSKNAKGQTICRFHTISIAESASK